MSLPDASQEYVEQQSRSGRKSLDTMMAFVLGVPLGLGLVLLMKSIAFDGFTLERYVKHPAEWATVVLFGCAVGALVTKLFGHWRERLALWTEFIGPWDGEPVPVGEAETLLQDFQHTPRSRQKSCLGQRLLHVLEFVRSRRSANSLDDQLRGLADTDEAALENSYSLIRFINWAIPILGFLGTVLGITEAIANVTPEALEKDLNSVTGGLTMAFDATALALALAMGTMFLAFLVERLEQGLLNQVNDRVDQLLAHRFERSGTGGGEMAGAMRHNTELLLETSGQLVQQQVALWSQSLQEAQRQWQEIGQLQQKAVAAGLGEALERTTTTHAERLAQQEQRSRETVSALVAHLQKLTVALTANATEQQRTLADLAGKINAQTEALARLTENSNQLAQMQEVLQQNLHVLAGTGAFEQAVNSLTAAIHLLTVRTGSATVPVATRNIKPGAAA
jgi:biopolymer transport protein ExbB/TolQ